MPTAKHLKTLAEWLEIDIHELVSDEKAYRVCQIREERGIKQAYLGKCGKLSGSDAFSDFLKLTARAEKGSAGSNYGNG